MATSPHVMASLPRSRSGCVSLVSEPRLRSPAYFMSSLVIVMFSVRIMPPHRKPCCSDEPSFPDIAQLGEVIANMIQFVIRSPQRTSLKTVYKLKLNHFMGNDGPERAERWLNQVEKSFCVMRSQGNILLERWIETTT